MFLLSSIDSLFLLQVKKSHLYTIIYCYYIHKKNTLRNNKIPLDFIFEFREEVRREKLITDLVSNPTQTNFFCMYRTYKQQESDCAGV